MGKPYLTKIILEGATQLVTVSNQEAKSLRGFEGTSGDRRCSPTQIGA